MSERVCQIGKKESLLFYSTDKDMLQEPDTEVTRYDLSLPSLAKRRAHDLSDSDLSYDACAYFTLSE